MNHNREIRQLFQIAEEYFKRAGALRKISKNHLNQKSGRIAKYYEKGMPTDPYKTALNLLLAHLSSAAVRLVTIDERFKEDHNYAIFPPYENEYQSNTKQTQLKKTFISKRDQYMHQLLRNNIGHIERSKNPPRKQTLWHARQDAIESLSVDQIFNAMSTVMERFRKWAFPLPCADTFSKPKDACKSYFDKLNEIREYNKGRNYFLLIYTCIESINLLPKMVRGWKQEFGGAFDIDSIPALEIGCKYLAVLQHKQHLDAIKLLLSEIKDLKGWLDYADYSYSLMELSDKVMTILKQQPGTMQNSLGQSLGVSGQETKTIVDILEKLNLVQRMKSGKTYALQMVNF